MENKKIIIFVVVVVLAGFSYYFVWQKNKVNKIAEQQKTQNQEQPAKTDSPSVQVVDNSKLPDKFPVNIPLEAGAQIEQNYNVDLADKTQASRRFASTKSLAENYKLYGDWLKQDGWEIQNTLDNSDLKALSAIKGEGSLNITISQNLTTKQIFVDISFMAVK